MKETTNLKKAIQRELSHADRVYALALLSAGIGLPTYLLAKLGR